MVWNACEEASGKSPEEFTRLGIGTHWERVVERAPLPAPIIKKAVCVHPACKRLLALSLLDTKEGKCPSCSTFILSEARVPVETQARVECSNYLRMFMQNPDFRKAIQHPAKPSEDAVIRCMINISIE